MDKNENGGAGWDIPTEKPKFQLSEWDRTTKKKKTKKKKQFIK